MLIWQAIFWAAVQGLTEFIPISSSAHLVILPSLFKLPVPSLFFDVSLHFGTLLSLLVYFRKEILTLFKVKNWRQNFPLFKALVIATLPAALIGILANDFFEKVFKTPLWAAYFLLGTAAIMVIAEKMASARKNELNLGWKEALFIGLAQAAAILPGLSRSGLTISAGLLSGLSRESSARFSFLLGIPIIFGSFLFELKEVSQAQIDFLPFLIGIIVSFLTGYLVIDFLLKYLKKGRLYLFSVYCFLIGLISEWWLS